MTLSVLKVNKIKKLVSNLDETYIKEIVGGIVGDVINRTYPNNTPMGVSYTLGDLNAIGGFYQLDWIVNDIIGAALGRSVRMICNQVGLTQQDLVSPQIMRILMSTNNLQQNAVEPVKTHLLELYGSKLINSDQEQLLYSQYVKIMAHITSQVHQ